MHYTAYLHVHRYAQVAALCFAVAALVFGLAFDRASLRLARRRVGTGRSVGLPIVPWMLYLLSSFLWMLRGDFAWAACQLGVMTAVHVAVHRRIHVLTHMGRSEDRPPRAPNSGSG